MADDHRQTRYLVPLLLILALAVPAGYVGWQYWIVRQREQLRDRVFDFDFGFGKHKPNVIRRWLGDEEVGWIVLDESRYEEDYAKIRRAFPEAQIWGTNEVGVPGSRDPAEDLKEVRIDQMMPIPKEEVKRTTPPSLPGHTAP